MLKFVLSTIVATVIATAATAEEQFAAATKVATEDQLDYIYCAMALPDLREGEVVEVNSVTPTEVIFADGGDYFREYQFDLEVVEYTDGPPQVIFLGDTYNSKEEAESAMAMHICYPGAETDSLS